MSDHRIYTRTGDAGETGLFGGGRVSKSHPRVEAYGGVDELNASLGWALTQLRDDWIRARLRQIQTVLFTVGAHLATPAEREGRPRPELPELPESLPADMETWIDEAEGELSSLRSFILPGGAPGAAALHVARTVCRRAERGVVELSQSEPVEPLVVVLLNRLSDFLFVAARRENRISGREDVPWDPAGRGEKLERGG